MLQHESQEQPTTTPAAQVRVTSEELAQAINALEASKDEAARHLAGTVPIGEVVKELNLEATPEEVWAQVQRQRAQAAQEEAARVRPAAPLVAPVMRDRSAARRTRGWRRLGRGWRGIKGWLWILFWCSGGLGLVSGVLHPAYHPAAAVSVSGDGQTLTSGTLGKNVEVSGDSDTLTLQGNCPTLTITGDGNRIRVEGTVGRVVADGDGNTVVYTQGTAPALSGNGDGNHVGPSAP